MRGADRSLGVVLDALASRWDDTVVFVVSDHEQEALDDRPALPLRRMVKDLGLAAIADTEGTAGLVIFDDPPDAEALHAVGSLEGVADVALLESTVAVLEAEPGRWFSPFEYPLRGGHGSTRTQRQVSVVGGGHAGVAKLASWVQTATPLATDYAPIMAELLGVARSPQ